MEEEEVQEGGRVPGFLVASCGPMGKIYTKNHSCMKFHHKGRLYPEGNTTGHIFKPSWMIPGTIAVE